MPKRRSWLSQVWTEPKLLEDVAKYVTISWDFISHTEMMRVVTDTDVHSLYLHKRRGNFVCRKITIARCSEPILRCHQQMICSLPQAFLCRQASVLPGQWLSPGMPHCPLEKQFIYVPAFILLSQGCTFCHHVVEGRNAVLYMYVIIIILQAHSIATSLMTNP